MPGKVKVKIIGGRNLPVMDRSSDTTDAYVEIKLGNTTYKTDVCRKSLHPQWNSEWYRFEVDDSELQDEPLQIRLMDHDTYSANDAIGKVYLDLNPLLLPAASLLKCNGEAVTKRERIPTPVMSGWIPVYDTMHGIRGEVNITVKVELFSDFNKFRQSSCGVQFFYSPTIPHGYYARLIHGFVEELVVNDDPEYQWIDKIRPPRVSNEARQTLFFKLSGELQRKVGVKALDLGGNAVIGYSQSFDLEGDFGIVARAVGTAVTLIKIPDYPVQHIFDSNREERAISYLKFLNADKGFRLNKKPHILKYNKIFIPRLPPILAHSLSPKPIHRDSSSPKKFTRHLSHTDFPQVPKSEIMHHSRSLQTLLKQEDMRGTPRSGISQRIKNFKYSSQNLLSKKMTALKAKLTDSNWENKVDSKGKKSKKNKSAMAEVLVTSVILAHNSLDCIMESTRDNPSNLQKQMSLNETLNDSLTKSTSAASYLSLPDTSRHNHSSNASDSSETSSSDEENYDNTRDEQIDCDTVSAVVKNVRRLSMLNRTDLSENISLQSDILEDDEGDSNDETDNFYFTDTEKKSEENASLQYDVISEQPEESASELTNYEEEVTKETEMRNFESNPEEHKIVFLIGEEPEESYEDEQEEEKCIPPLAEMDDFSIYSSDEEYTKNDNYPETYKSLDDSLARAIHAEAESNMENRAFSSESALNDLPVINVNILKRKMLLPKSKSKTDELESQGLIETAVQTMLLDRVNIVGTCTPPTLPTFNTEKNQAWFPENGKNKLALKQSSMDDNILSRGEDEITSSLAIQNSRKKFPKMSSNQTLPFVKNKLGLKHSSLDDSILSKTDDGIPIQNGRKKKSKEDLSLLNIALKTMLIESVNDVLATSSLSENALNPDLVTSNSESVFHKNLTPSVLPGNIEIEQGNNANQLHASLHPSPRPSGSPVDYSRQECGHQRTESMGAKVLQSPAKISTFPCIHRRSSDSDLSITPKGNSLTGSDRSSGAITIMSHFTRNNAVFRPIVPQDNFDIMEYPFLTMSKYPPGFVAYLGGAVSARSVKLLERISNIEEPESRDTWWSEIRMEIRSHAKAYNCNSVLGYSETTSICDDVCVLSASGTAAIIGYQYSGETADSLGVLPIIPKPNVANRDVLSSSLDRADFDKERKITESVPIAHNNKNNNNSINFSENLEKEIGMHAPNNVQSCMMCHLPYTGSSASMRGKIYKCAVCKSGKVPEILIATIELPEGIPCVGRGCFLQSYISRPIKDLKGESYAKEISDGLPFLEYELHRILVNKLKVKGMNAIFGLKIRISIGEKMLIGIATGTAVFLSPLPSPPLPKLVCDRTTNMSKLGELQKQLHETIRKNKETYQLRLEVDQNGKSDSDDSEDEQTVLDLGVGNKDCCILEVDDPEDVEILNLLMELRPPDGFHVVNTELVPGLQELEIVKNLQMFIQIWRAKIQPPHFLEKHFQRLLETVYFKLRRMIPCALCDLQFRVDSPEPDEIQLCVLGMALGLGDPQKNTKLKGKLNHIKRNDDELIFNLEEDNIPENSVAQTPSNSSYLPTQLSKNRQKSPQRCKTIVKQRHVPYRERHGVDITPLSYVPGGKIERYLGNLNFFFIRETTSVREEGGFSAFIHSFVTEVLAIIRAHVTALGGNAMVAYFMTECVLNQNIHKNQGQCLINVGGDVVYVSYFSEDQ